MAMKSNETEQKYEGTIIQEYTKEINTDQHALINLG